MVETSSVVVDSASVVVESAVVVVSTVSVVVPAAVVVVAPGVVVSVPAVVVPVTGFVVELPVGAAVVVLDPGSVGLTLGGNVVRTIPPLEVLHPEKNASDPNATVFIIIV